MSELAVKLRRVPPPALRPGEHGDVRWSAVTALAVRATIDLAGTHRFRDLPGPARLQAAIDEQRSFLGSLLEPDAAAVYDLRLVALPENAGLLTAGIVIRSWGDADDARARVLALARAALHGAPDHVVLEPACGPQLSQLLDPLGDRGGARHAAFVTRAELVGMPVREDVRQQISYHYSIAGWPAPHADWTSLYARLSAATQPLVLSVALAPRRTDPELAAWLDRYTSSYRLWASPGRTRAGISSGGALRAPEPFAVDAATTFAAHAKRLRAQSFAMRILLASPQPLPAGLAQAVAATLASPADREVSVATGCAVRGDAGGIAAFDLEAVDVCTPDADPPAWGDDYPPPPALLALTILGDPDDAACAFRLPIAYAGDLPGLPSRPWQADGERRATAGRSVFLCHSVEDKPAVRRLYRRLRDDGFAPWLDEEDQRPGEIWELAIGNALRTVDHVAVCLSRASVSKVGYINVEIKRALEAADRHPEGSNFVIPVLLEACEPPPSLKARHCVRLFADGGYDRLARELRR